MNGFEVLHMQVPCMIEDGGRIGLGNIGVSEAGALDEHAFHWANKLLNNPYGTNALEIVFGGIELRARGRMVFILTGAEVRASINNEPIELWKTYEISENEILKIGFCISGLRVYLGVRGGFQTNFEYGSFSVNLKEGIGGRVVKKGDFLPCTPSCYERHRRIPFSFIPDYSRDLRLRLVAGYQYDSFLDEEKEKFFSSKYSISKHNDRMGYRLKGEKIMLTCKGIISEPISFGAVQIPPNGEPIILLKERQTIGGYPKMGSVLALDCFSLAQRAEGAKVSFELINLEEARKIMKVFYTFFKINF
jgi:biotin-dependent carboxylase-like uncharacterized protein